MPSALKRTFQHQTVNSLTGESERVKRMSTQAMKGDTAVLDQVVTMAESLPPLQKVQLVERLMTMLERELTSLEVQPQPLNTWRGLCADLGAAPTAEDIDEARNEV